MEASRDSEARASLLSVPPGDVSDLPHSDLSTEDIHMSGLSSCQASSYKETDGSTNRSATDISSMSNNSKPNQMHGVLNRREASLKLTPNRLVFNSVSSTSDDIFAPTNSPNSTDAGPASVSSHIYPASSLDSLSSEPVDLQKAVLISQARSLENMLEGSKEEATEFPGADNRRRSSIGGELYRNSQTRSDSEVGGSLSQHDTGAFHRGSLNQQSSSTGFHHRRRSRSQRRSSSSTRPLTMGGEEAYSPAVNTEALDTSGLRRRSLRAAKDSVKILKDKAAQPSSDDDDAPTGMRKHEDRDDEMGTAPSTSDALDLEVPEKKRKSIFKKIKGFKKRLQGSKQKDSGQSSGPSDNDTSKDTSK